MSNKSLTMTATGNQTVEDALAAARGDAVDAYGALYQAIGELARAHRKLDKLADGAPTVEQIREAMAVHEAALSDVIRLARERNRSEQIAEAHGAPRRTDH